VTVAHINLLDKRFSMHRMGSHYNKEIFLNAAVIDTAITEAILGACVVAAVKLTTSISIHNDYDFKEPNWR
jgi:hypothetical protein